MSEISFIIKIYAINPAYDTQGNEYIKIDYGYKPPQVPFMYPVDMPKEVTEVIEASRNMVKVMIPQQIQTQSQYSNRLTLYLRTDEWEKLQQKYNVGEEFEVIIKLDGNFSVRRL